MNTKQTSLDTYEKLIDALGKLPIGFPRTKSRVELQILERLFSVEEAKVASYMAGTSETVEAIAQKVGLPKEAVEPKLTSMLARGMIWSSVKDGIRKYRLAPFMVGFYEQQSETMDHDLAHLFEHYWMEGGGKGIMKYHPDTHRVDPAHEALKKTETILPYNDVRKLMEQAKSFQARNCICRRQQELLDTKKCNFPVRNCISFLPVELPPGPNTITKEAALKLLDEAEEAGLVHCVANQQNGLYWVCNCCGCCCGILRGILELGIENTSVRANYFAIVDPDKCNSCGICEDRCHMNAISINGTASIDQVKCIGCGVCITGCPTDALNLKLRADTELITPAENYKAWEQARLRNRGLSH
ncbi:MAG: 4Fe-4S dicluster domain-containing protein [Chloroflexi bacterium]|nr:4Fe-4S dicluster domain-containing protein [Chloroflexota bacterium]MBM3182659.1 4Fe-4S dicluster domain-containing protein [Chloroflexota bacterium]MBM4451362.1 4Fe-4S dicluster domain-containing protein [Chloroflexota bacterium]MBM4453267.1 4Fe-4S dicluster domain-containing protein [Chloroflexota bacterium]